jgi:hypothetical protein
VPLKYFGCGDVILVAGDWILDEFRVSCRPFYGPSAFVEEMANVRARRVHFSVRPTEIPKQNTVFRLKRLKCNPWAKYTYIVHSVVFLFSSDFISVRFQ